MVAVADYLGVTIDPAVRVSVPEIERQNQDGARAWAEAYDAGEDAGEGSA